MVVKMSSRGTVTLPKDIREGLSEETFFDVVRREDGVIELHPRMTIVDSQAWFWTERWQKMEREVDESYTRGDFRRFESGEEFLAELERLAAESRAEREGGKTGTEDR